MAIRLRSDRGGPPAGAVAWCRIGEGNGWLVDYLRPCVRSVEAYKPGEQPSGEAHIVKLNTNESPYPPSPRCAEAIAAELIDGGARLRLYSDPSAWALRQAASLAFGVPIDQVLHGNGSDELLVMLLRALVEPGQAVAYPAPTYPLYEVLARAHGAVAEAHPFEAGFKLPDSLHRSRAKLVLVASPNSPSGNSHSVEALRTLARARQDAVVVVDEAYADFATQNAMSLVSELENVVVLRTLSKSYSLAGMRVGLLFASAPLVAGVAKVKDSYNLDRLAIVAGAAALRDEPWMRKNVDRIVVSRTRLTEGLRARGLEVLPSDANFVFARLADATQAERAFRILRDRGVLVRYFAQPELADGLRITVGTDAQVDRLLAALSEALSAR